MKARAQTLGRRATATTIVVALQSMAVIFFLGDLAEDIAIEGWSAHLAIEGFAAIALLVAVVMGAFQIRSLLAAAGQDEAAVAVAKGALADLVQLKLSHWHLTPAEADVALFALKGCDIADIAALRGTAAGTIRAQLARIYAKAGVGSHAGLLAIFVEGLLDMPVVAPALTATGEDNR